MNARPRRYKVTIVVTAAVTARLFVCRYAEYLAEKGYLVTLITDDVDMLVGDVSPSVQLKSIPMRREPSPFHDLLSLAHLLWFLSTGKPDALIYGTPKASLLSALAGSLLGVPVRLYNIWGLRLETSHGCTRVILSFLERVTMHLSTLRVANSRSLATRLTELGLVRHGKVLVLGEGSSHGVDATHFSRTADFPDVDATTREFLASPAAVVLGFVGRVHPDKGIDVFVRAVRALNQEGVSTRALVVGADEGAAWAPGDVLTEVRNVGEVRDIRPYLARIDVLVLMSKREGFPNVVLEAAAMGIPAVVSDSTGCVDSVLDGETGFVVPLQQEALLRDRLALLAMDPGLRSRLGENARRRALSRFDVNTVMGLNERALADALDAGSAK